jgi:hypothetical protein
MKWEMYAIGGSASPTILSHGNRFLANKAEVSVLSSVPFSTFCSHIAKLCF